MSARIMAFVVVLITNHQIPPSGVEIGGGTAEVLAPRFCEAPMHMVASLQRYRDGE